MYNYTKKQLKSLCMANDLILSKSDMWMAASHVMQLGGYYVLQSAFESGDAEEFALAFAATVPLLIGGGVIHSLANWRMLPRDTSFLRKIISFPFLTDVIVHGYGVVWFGTIKKVSNLYTVAQTAWPKLAHCASALTTRPIRALCHGVVHAFNLIFAGLPVWDSLEPNIPSFAKQDVFSRLTDPKFNPRNVKDAHKMFQLPHQTADALTCHLFDCGQICDSVRRAWRQISLRVHPDKTSNPLANEAFRNCSNAHETLKLLYHC